MPLPKIKLRNPVQPQSSEAQGIAAKKAAVDEYLGSVKIKPVEEEEEPSKDLIPSKVDRVESKAPAGEHRISNADLEEMSHPLGRIKSVPASAPARPSGLGTIVPVYDDQPIEDGDHQLAIINDDEARQLAQQQATVSPAADAANAGKMKMMNGDDVPAKEAPLVGPPAVGQIQSEPGMRETGKMRPLSGSSEEEVSGVAKVENRADPNHPFGPQLTAPDELKHHIVDLKDTMEQGYQAGDLVKAGRAKLALNELEKANPYGSAANRPGWLGKIEHGLSTLGQVAGQTVLGPNIMAAIPGTRMNLNTQEAGGAAQVEQGVKENLDTAQAKNLESETAARNAPKETKYVALNQQYLDTKRLVDSTAPGTPEHAAAVRDLGNISEAMLAGKTEPAPKGSEVLANDVQLAEFSKQIPALMPHLSAAARDAYTFPIGYKPTVGEIATMKKDASSAESAALAGDREKMAQQTANAQANKKTMEENLIETTAQSIASMDIKDLSPLKDISSMRSDLRTQIYNRAKEINKNFNTAEVKRRADAVNNYTNGTDGKNLQSFGTFLQHAGEANELVQGIRNSVTPKFLNMGLNEAERQGWGTTATQITAALEPVKKEFEGFLLGGRALLGEDRKAADVILNDASTPAQIQAALKTMGHTVVARYDEAENRFKDITGSSLEGADIRISDEALNSAYKIGVTKLGAMEHRDGKQGSGWYEVKQ